MTNLNELDCTIAQLTALAAVMDELRPLGFDAEGSGPHSPNLHAAVEGGRLVFWLDGDDGVANGRIGPDGHGVWWLRRTYAPRMHAM